MPHNQTIFHDPQQTRAQDAAAFAHDLIVFCDGLEEAGNGSAVYARRSRHLARETIWLAQELDLERRARDSMVAEVERLRALWMRKAGRAA